VLYVSYLSYKANRAGGRVVKVDPRNASLNILHAGSDCPESLWTGNLCYTSPSLKACIVSFLEEAGNPHREVGMPVHEDGVVHKN